MTGPDGPLPKLSKTFPRHIDEQLFCGLDIGVGSCGQALVSPAGLKVRGFEDLPDRIAFLGVRTFDVPETKEQSGVKLKNPERRQKRLMRRVIARRAHRMRQVRSLLVARGVLPADYHCRADIWRARHEQATPWQWRLEALERALTPWEWAVILMHYAKRRGFKSARKSDRETKGAAGGTLQSVRANHEALQAYRTLAEMFGRDQRFNSTVQGAGDIARTVETRRNRDGNYVAMVLRADLLEEIRAVFLSQRQRGNPQAAQDFEAAYLAIVTSQKPMQDPVKLLGDCPFLPGIKRTTSYAPSFELSRALQRLNAVTLVHPDGARGLLSEHILANGGYEPFVAAFGKARSIPWAAIRTMWGIPDDIQFKDVLEGNRKSSRTGAVESIAAAEKRDFCKRSSAKGAAEGTYLLRKAVGDTTWNKLLAGDLAPADEVAFSLAFYEVLEDEESEFTILGSMAARKIPAEFVEPVRNDLLGERPTLHKFKGTCGVSAELCRRILPHLMRGLTYDKAMMAAGFKHTETVVPFDQITNPIVKSVIREVLKQVVHLFDEAGALPGRIHIEVARDLGKSIDERNEMERGIVKRTREKDKHRKEVAELKGCEPGAVAEEDLLRYELYLEQGGICPYSGESLPNAARIYGPDLQVDHILPRSRSHDNSFDNKVLVHTRANQHKQNKTPHEWLAGEPEAWQGFRTRILALPGLRFRKRRNLLDETFGTEGQEQKFAERNLNDTRYICRLVMGYIEALYGLQGHAPTREGGARRVFARPGPMTALVRRAWGLENLKKDNDGKRIGDKHHAVDALVCACLAENEAQWITRLSQAYSAMERAHVGTLAVRGLPPPWADFRSAVVAALRKITVSRRERCGAGGALHDETIYRARPGPAGETMAFKREALVGRGRTGKPEPAFTSASDLEQIAGINEERSRWLKEALLAWISQGSPLDPGRLPRDPQGCLIRKVFVKQKQIKLRRQPQGHVTSGTQVRLDVFSNKGQYHLVPVYAHQLTGRMPPMRAIVANKPETAWTLIDESFHFEFSLWKNSRFEIGFKKGTVIQGCYSSVNRNTGRITYFPPDNQKGETGEDGSIQDYGFSTKVGVASFRKIAVDRLGRAFQVKGEKRTWRGAVCT